MAAPSAIARTDVIGLIGDSLTFGFGQSDGWSFNFMRTVKSRYAQAIALIRPSGLSPAPPRSSVVAPAGVRGQVGYEAQRFPSYFMNASPGRKVGDISGIMATILAPFIAGRTTVYIVALGRNDIVVTAAATFIPQATAIRDAIIAAPYFKMLVWAGPGTGGEDWPDGANSGDLATDGFKDKDDQLAALMASAPGCFYVSWRQLRIASINATTNPAHLAQGIYTYDGTHPTNEPTATTTVSGGDLLASYTAAQLSFQ
jgi:hypothetical protein